MAVKYYLHIPGLDGESTDVAHAGWIDIESYRGREKSSDGTVTLKGHDFTKTMDKATKSLMEAAMKGEHFPEVTLQAVRQGKGGGRERQAKVIEYVFEDALITKYSLGPSGDDVTPESFTLVVEKVTRSHS